MTMSNGVRVVVKVVARTEAIAEITAIVLKLAAHSRKETGCVSYEVLKDMNNAEIFVLIEEWTSLAALDAHTTRPRISMKPSAILSPSSPSRSRLGGMRRSAE
jgi:quinol monooxygenase YgiN